MSDMNHREQNGNRGIASSVLSRIEAEHVVPIPRSRFVVKESAVWAMGVFAIVMGSLGVASLIFTARFSEWEYYEATHDTILTFAMDIAPYAWLISLLIFTVLAYEAIRHTKRGYRYPVPALTLAVIGASMIGGVAVSATGGGRFADHLAEYVPPYRSLEERKLVVWNKPDRGLIAGIVTDISEDGASFTLRSPSNELHTIHTDTMDPNMMENVVVGMAMRVMAPLVERSPFAYETSDADASMVAMDASNSAEGDVVLMTTEGAPEMAADEAMEATSLAQTEDPGAATMMMKAAPMMQNAPVPQPVLLREACAIIPMDKEGAQNRRDMVMKCMHAMKEARAAAGNKGE
jgi:hypothetical protein